MTSHAEDHVLEHDELDPEADGSEEDEDAGFDRAPQPGNTPAPGEAPYDSGALTSDEDD